MVERRLVTGHLELCIQQGGVGVFPGGGDGRGNNHHGPLHIELVFIVEPELNPWWR